jgi:hypothetical protein
VSGAEDEMKYRWTAGARFIANQIPRASVRTTLTYRLFKNLSAGFEYNPRADEVNVIANWVALSETQKRPALIFGTSSERIGTNEGQSFYATVSKSLKGETHLPIAPYVGIAYGTKIDGLRVIGGLNIKFTNQLSSTVIFDGVHVHPLLNFSYNRHALSFILVRGRDAGISYSISF